MRIRLAGAATTNHARGAPPPTWHHGTSEGTDKKGNPMSQNTTPADTTAKPEWEPKPGRVLVLRTSNAGRRGWGGFQWPESGPVSAPDLRDDTNCGHGLHGLLWGAGDASYLGSDADAVWQVVDVAADDIRDLGDKVKFPGGVVVYSGVRDLAVGLVQEHAPAGTPVNYGTATAGDDGTATAGDYGTATAGDDGTATAGNYGTATAGDYGTATAGDDGTATAGNYGTATAGYDGTATAGNYGTATAGDYGTATAGNYGTATAGNYGTATAGDYGTATAGYRGVIAIMWWDDERDCIRRAIAEVTEDGPVKPGIAYRVEYGAFVAADTTTAVTE